MMLLLAAAFSAVQSQHAHPAPPASTAILEVVQRPVALRAGIGTAPDAVGTSSKDAQAFYDQGLAYLHSYVWLEAARSFQQALALDSTLALAPARIAVAHTATHAHGP